MKNVFWNFIRLLQNMKFSPLAWNCIPRLTPRQVLYQKHHSYILCIQENQRIQLDICRTFSHHRLSDIDIVQRLSHRTCSVSLVCCNYTLSEKKSKHIWKFIIFYRYDKAIWLHLGRRISRKLVIRKQVKRTLTVEMKSLCRMISNVRNLTSSRLSYNYSNYKYIRLQVGNMKYPDLQRLQLRPEKFGLHLHLPRRSQLTRSTPRGSQVHAIKTTIIYFKYWYINASGHNLYHWWWHFKLIVIKKQWQLRIALW